MTQLINLLGSIPAGVPIAQRESSQDSERAEAYRTLMRQQVTTHGRTSAEDVAAIDDRMVVQDPPEDRPPPSFFLKRPKPENQNDEIEESESEPGSNLDLLL